MGRVSLCYRPASSFDLDFVVVLDWLDPQLVENVHFGAGNNAGPNGSKFRLLDAVATDPAFFNPEIKVDNGLAVELVEGEDSNSGVPRIKKVLMVPEAGEVGARAVGAGSRRGTVRFVLLSYENEHSSCCIAICCACAICCYTVHYRSEPAQRKGTAKDPYRFCFRRTSYTTKDNVT